MVSTKLSFRYLFVLVIVCAASSIRAQERSEEHTSELQSQSNLVCRLLLEKKKKKLSPTRSSNNEVQIDTLMPTQSSVHSDACKNHFCLRYDLRSCVLFVLYRFYLL